MAKKKTESDAAKPAAKKEAAKKEPAKKSAAPVANEFMINTSNAASAAAALVGNKFSVGASSSSAPRPESSAFKAMKQNLANPSAGMGNMLPQASTAKKSNQPFASGKQVGHNQTFGADVNRAGVPRRTGGG